MLLNIINSVLNVPQSTCTDISSDISDKFLFFSVDKIYAIGASISLPTHDPFLPVSCPAAFSKFSFVLKTFFYTTGPISYILNIINSSLNTGIRLKHAIVQPLTLNPNLDASVLSNCRPISKLPSLSKVFEKVVLTQLQSYLDANGTF